MACLLHLFKKPQINYRSSSTALSNCDLYSYFYRTFPSYNKQAQLKTWLTSYYILDGTTSPLSIQTIFMVKKEVSSESSCQKCQHLLESVLKDLMNPMLIAACRALGLIDKIVTGP